MLLTPAGVCAVILVPCGPLVQDAAPAHAHLPSATPLLLQLTGSPSSPTLLSPKTHTPQALSPAPHRTHHRSTRCEETPIPRTRPTRGFFDFLGLLGLAQPADTGPRPPTRRLDRSAPDCRACPGTLAVAPQRLAPHSPSALDAHATGPVAVVSRSLP